MKKVDIKNNTNLIKIDIINSLKEFLELLYESHC